jgi:peptidoglycan hydrolase CwlO-like protein
MTDSEDMPQTAAFAKFHIFRLQLRSMAKPKGKAPPFLFQATGVIVKRLRPDIQAVQAEISNINTEIKAINQRITAINSDLDKIEARTAKLKVEVGETGAQ